ncbi:hypothetical protein ACWCQN_31185 [Streptomyces sp. NPDC001984]|uniref:hypothetical protein n=1 Tax=Streptomyces sp. NPDC002619 TaxID=3364655 RepID=UPI0036CD569F
MDRYGRLTDVIRSNNRWFSKNGLGVRVLRIVQECLMDGAFPGGACLLRRSSTCAQIAEEIGRAAVG